MSISEGKSGRGLRKEGNEDMGVMKNGRVER